MRRSISFLFVGWLLVGGMVAQNILNNGGFEYGLMCYSSNIWSYTGNPYSGDYRFLLSPDAHSGSNSLELRCVGTDCYKAAVVSNNIPTKPNQAYKLNLYTKCAPGSATRVFIPEVASGYVFRDMACTGAWAPNQVEFTSTSTAKEFFFYLFHYEGTPGSWTRFDDVVLTYADGTAPQEVVLHPGVRNVRVGNRAIEVDGAPYLNLGFFDVPYDDLAQAAAVGANTVHGFPFQPAANCYNSSQTGYLDRMYELGLNFVPNSATTARLGSADPFPSIIQRFAPHQAVIAWMLADEPDQVAVPEWYIQPAKFLAIYNAAKAKTTLPLFADFQRGWSVPGDVAPYVDGIDFWMGEPYGTEFQWLSRGTNLFRSLKPRPIWLAQDAIDPALIVPKAYWAMINGSTGIVYFIWDYFKSDPAKMNKARQAFSELKQLKSVIFGQPIDSLVTVPNGLGYMARYSGNAAYILAANPSAPTIQGKFLVKGLAAGQQVTALFENRTITAAAGEFTDSFAGPSRHVYMINSPLVALAGTLAAKTGLDAARTWRIQVSNTGIGVATAAQITGLSLTQTAGATCAPASIPGNLPVSLGDIAPGVMVPGDILINFTNCDTTARFTARIALAASGGTATGTVVRNNERK